MGRWESQMGILPICPSEATKPYRTRGLKMGIQMGSDGNSHLNQTQTGCLGQMGKNLRWAAFPSTIPISKPVGTKGFMASDGQMGIFPSEIPI